MSVRQVKILYIITQGELGGAQKYVFDLAMFLKSKFDITVATGSEKTELGKKLKIKNKKIKVIYLKHLVRNINPLKEILAVAEIKKLIEIEKPDVAHLNSSKAGVLGSIAGWLTNTPVIFTAHGLAYLEPKPWIVRQIYYWAEWFAMRFRAKVITVSEYDRQKALEHKLGRPEQFITVHNGIEEFEMLSREEALQRLKIKDKKLKIIGTIAHDYPSKDLKTLRRAFEIVKKDHPETRLVIIGQGSEVGEVPEARKYLSAFNIYVSSSVKEGFPYSILEAATAGLPIVATRVGGIPEILEHEKSGLLAAPKKPEEMAEQIMKLIENQKLREELGKRARERAKKFTIERMVKETLAVYNEFL